MRQRPPYAMSPMLPIYMCVCMHVSPMLSSGHLFSTLRVKHFSTLSNLWEIVNNINSLLPFGSKLLILLTISLFFFYLFPLNLKIAALSWSCGNSPTLTIPISKQQSLFVFDLQKRQIHTIMHIPQRECCRQHFKLGILTTPCIYILVLIC